MKRGQPRSADNLITRCIQWLQCRPGTEEWDVDLLLSDLVNRFISLQEALSASRRKARRQRTALKQLQRAHVQLLHDTRRLREAEITQRQTFSTFQELFPQGADPSAFEITAVDMAGASDVEL